MHKYIVTGPQGCGKGTQAGRLKRDYDFVHISVGDIFRWNIQNHSKLGARIKRIVGAGELVPDSIVEEVVKTRLERHDWNFGFVLDGFPRNRAQAEFFLESYSVDAVILIDVPDEVVTKRILSRRLCEKCGLDYNLIYHRPKVDDICDVCGGRLVSRADDTPEGIAERLRAYHDKTAPMLELFRRKDLVRAVDGTKTVDEIQAEIRSVLRLPEVSKD